MRIKPLVTIVTVNYNQRDDLRRTVASVLEQDFQEMTELVVVDGGSTDGSAEFLRGVRSPSDVLSFSFVSRRDAGIADAMNTGLALAHGEWLIYLNGGDVFNRPGSLRVLMSSVQGRPAADRYYYSGVRVVEPGGKLVRVWQPPAYSERRLFLRNYIPHPTVIFPTAALRGLGGFDQSVKIALDYELWLKAALMGMSGEKHDHCEIDFLDGGVSSNWAAMLREERRVRLKWARKGPGGQLYDAAYTGLRYVKNIRKNHA